MNKTYELVWDWTISKARDTYGYNRCTLRVNGVKVAVEAACEIQIFQAGDRTVVIVTDIDTGPSVTNIEVLADGNRYAGETPWFMPDFEGTASLNLRVVEGEAERGYVWHNPPKLVEELWTVAPLAMEYRRDGKTLLAVTEGVINPTTGEPVASPGIIAFETPDDPNYQVAWDKAEELVAVLTVRFNHAVRDWHRFNV